MALDFPTSPALNQVYTFGSYSWRWDGTSWVGAVPIVNATINNTTIGAVTPSTGAFTSLTSTSGAFNGTVGATTPSTIAGTTGTFTSDIEINGGNKSFYTSAGFAQFGTTGNHDAFIIRQATQVATFTSTGLNSTAIGATTPSTGAFTTLSASGTATFTKSANSAGSVAALLQNADGNSGIGARLAWRLDNLANEWGYINVNRVGGGATAQMDIAVNGAAFSGAPSVVASLTSTGLNSTAIGATTPSTVAGTTGTFSSGFITNNANSATELSITNTNTGVSARARLAFVTDLGTSAFISYRRAIGDFIIGSDLNIPVSIYSNAAAVGTFTSTGLNSTAIGATTPSTGAFTTLYQGASGAQGLNVGFSGAAGQGFTLRDTTNSRTYFITTETATGLQINSGANPITLVGNTNVTGALSATGALSIGSSPGSGRNFNLGNGINSDAIIRTSAATSATGSMTLYFGNANRDDEGWISYANGTRTLSLRAGDTTVANITSTGLAVTGALSSDSLVKIGGTVNGSSGLQFDVSRSLSGVEWFGSVSGAGYGHRAIEDDSGAGFSRFKLQGRVNSASWTTVLQVDGTTGLAVTGALSCTGALAIGNTVNTVSPTSPNRTVTIVIGGTTYYLAAKTTND